jgi:ubiquinone/menaquinone biosynthesis C-methylase UbiE
VRGRLGRSVGIVPTAEEKAKLQATYPGLTVLVGRAQKLPVDSESASLIVCNSVLLLLKSEDNVSAALSEIVRVARPPAKIWLGEIPSADEYPYFKNYRGSSLIGLLWHQLTRKGFHIFLSTGKEVCKSLMGKETLVLSSGEIYYATPQEFIALAQKCGMQLKTHFKYIRKDRSGKLIESPFRYNYVFTR